MEMCDTISQRPTASVMALVAFVPIVSMIGAGCVGPRNPGASSKWTESSTLSAQKLCCAIFQALQSDVPEAVEAYLPDESYADCGRPPAKASFFFGPLFPLNPEAWRKRIAQDLPLSVRDTHRYAELLGIDWSQVWLTSFKVVGLPSGPSADPKEVGLELLIQSDNRTLWLYCPAGYGKAGLRLLAPCLATTLGECERTRLMGWLPGFDVQKDEEYARLILKHKLTAGMLEFLHILGCTGPREIEVELVIQLPPAFDAQERDSIQVAPYEGAPEYRKSRLTETDVDSFCFEGLQRSHLPASLLNDARFPSSPIRVELPREKVSDVRAVQEFSAIIKEGEKTSQGRERRFVRLKDRERSFRTSSVEVYDLGKVADKDYLIRLTLTDNIATDISFVKRSGEEEPVVPHGIGKERR